MLVEIKAIIIAKSLQKENDFKLSVLSPDGEHFSLYCKNALSKKKFHQATILEVGYCLHFKCKKLNEYTNLALDWSLHWSHQNIRYNIKSYYLLCFYIDTIAKMISYALPYQNRYYAILAQSLYQLDQCKKPQINEIHYLLLDFLKKVLSELGIVTPFNISIQSIGEIIQIIKKQYSLNLNEGILTQLFLNNKKS